MLFFQANHLTYNSEHTGNTKIMSKSNKTKADSEAGDILLSAYIITVVVIVKVK